MNTIQIVRMAEGKHSTLGHLYIGGVFCCYTLEDTVREVKIPAQTAIPAGRYTLRLNVWGGMNGRYQNLFSRMHRGMIEVKGIPNFSLVYFHLGNTHTDTAGCLLVGTHFQLRQGDYRLLQSMVAYKEVYPTAATTVSLSKTGSRRRVGPVCPPISRRDATHCGSTLSHHITYHENITF